MSETYDTFLARKSQFGEMSGFTPSFLPDFLFDFQKSLVDWSIRKGRAAIFANTGLGKTICQLTWAENVVRKTNKPVLVLTPLAVSYQTVMEAHKFDIDAVRCPDGKITTPRIYVANYERLHYFSPAQFSGVVCDESSCIKAFTSQTRHDVTEFLSQIPYRLLCTATPAPNDWLELGTSAEALSVMRRVEMLAQYFTHDSGNTSQWRLKKHAAGKAFWQWCGSWARAIRNPSDLGFSDDGFLLPPLKEEQHIVRANKKADGMLFSLPAMGLTEQREERRRTLAERCEKVAELTNNTGNSALVWCHLNPEGDLLSELITDAQQISGADKEEKKEELFLAFIKGELRVLVTKPVIGAWGLNLQNCAHMTFFGSNSWEQWYQGIRRCWRFGQKKPVKVDLVVSEGEQRVLANLQRKAKQAEEMFAAFVNTLGQVQYVKPEQRPMRNEQIPSWLS